jgi:hypothetical protein
MCCRWQRKEMIMSNETRSETPVEQPRLVRLPNPLIPKNPKWAFFNEMAKWQKHPDLKYDARQLAAMVSDGEVAECEAYRRFLSEIRRHHTINPSCVSNRTRLARPIHEPSALTVGDRPICRLLSLAARLFSSCILRFYRSCCLCCVEFLKLFSVSNVNMLAPADIERNSS